MDIKWDELRRADQSIDLQALANNFVRLGMSKAVIEDAKRWLAAVEDARPIKSRQLAVVAVMTALDIAVWKDLTNAHLRSHQ